MIECITEVTQIIRHRLPITGNSSDGERKHARDRMSRTTQPRMRVTAGRGVGKVEPGSEKILGVELNFKIDICLAHSRSDVELKKLRVLCEAYVKSIKQDHNKIHI